MTLLELPKDLEDVTKWLIRNSVVLTRISSSTFVMDSIERVGVRVAHMGVVYWNFVMDSIERVGVRVTHMGVVYWNFKLAKGISFSSK